MDLDGDGQLDILSGSYDGRPHWVKGVNSQGASRFLAPEIVLDGDGEELIAGKYWDYEAKLWTDTGRAGHADAHGISAAAVDWDSDGDQDLVLGMSDGRLFLRRNEGTAKEPQWSTRNEKIKYGKRSLFVRAGGAMPSIADWNADGKFDILSGSKDGAVHLWINIGSAQVPDFAPPVELVPAADESAGPHAPGTRTQVHACDFDGDGDLDLLVGDYRRDEKARHGWVWLYRRGAPQ